MRGSHHATASPLKGYEIHIGQSTGPDCARPFAEIEGIPEGACSVDGSVCGSYLHGLFVDDTFRAAYLGALGATAPGTSYSAAVDATLDELADHIERHLDVSGLLALAR